MPTKEDLARLKSLVPAEPPTDPDREAAATSADRTMPSLRRLTMPTSPFVAPEAPVTPESETRDRPQSIGSSEPNPNASTRIEPALDPLVGQLVAGKYRIDELLAVGGMGKVYKARHEAMGRVVCVKTLRPALLDDKTTVGRFEREAKAASRLTHPNAITVFDFGEDGHGSLYLAMEYVPGRDLRTLLIQEFPLGEARICRLMAQVLSALADAHAQGIIHRDLKPENIMVEARKGEAEFVKVLDFGIAKVLDGEGPALTLADRICGTPLYMSPEQATGGAVDARSDLYAAGVILYQLATGLLPFYSQNTVEVLTRHVHEKPLAPRQAAPDQKVSPELEAIILRAMAKEPAKRPQSATLLREELLRHVDRLERAPVVPTAPPEELRPIAAAMAKDEPQGVVREVAEEPEPKVAPRIEAPSESRIDLAAALPKHGNRTTALVAGALALAALVLVFAFKTSPDKAAAAPTGAPATTTTNAVPAMALATSCAAGMTRDGASTCLAAEPLRTDANHLVTNLDRAGAEAACASNHARLCSEAEWCAAAAKHPLTKSDAAEWTTEGVVREAGGQCRLIVPARAAGRHRQAALVRCCADLAR